jgi:tetratricopeptide (TPR) repeat protein
LRIRPDDAPARSNLGTIYLAQNRWDEAIRECQAALRRDPSLAQAHYNLGMAYGAQGRLDDEIHEYQAAVRIDPDYNLARANLGMAYGQQGRWDEAAREIEAALPSKEQARSLLNLFRGMAASPKARGLRLRITLSDGKSVLYAAPSPDAKP